MNAQPEALRLADALEQDYCSCHEGFKIRNRVDPQCESCQTKDWRNEAAAELRRLHAELERCKQVCAATAEGWRSERDELLKALRDIAEFSLEQPTKAVARAAIATVEGEKT